MVCSMDDGRRRGVEASRSESEQVGVSWIGNVRMNRSGRQNSSAIGQRERRGGRSEGADCQSLRLRACGALVDLA